MSNVLPEPLAWTCEGKTLLGLLHHAPASNGKAVIIVPGGTQYRVGAHRGFVDLAERLASHGHPTLRFDCRGMGDSGGQHPGFTNLHKDVASAITALKLTAPEISQIIVFGLCDGATAALLAAEKIQEINGLILCNTWVRSPASEAATVLNHHYRARVFDKTAWQRLLLGRINILSSVKSVFQSIISLQHKSASVADLVGQVTIVWENNLKPVLSIIGGKDFTGAEFAKFIKDQPAKPNVTVKTIASGDHSLSGSENSAALARACLDWLAGL